mgnify:CR=1 FL=1|tara:strand:- start:551 stop:1333 length:783 start_codon:yes stop_codon:yes gene_type:complete
MFKKLLQYFLILLFIFPFISSCGGANRHTVNDIAPLESFVYLRKVLTVHRCEDNLCTSVDLKYSASGYVIKIVDDGSFAITAAHVCETADLPTVNPKDVSSKYLAYRLDGEEYRASVLEYNMDIDACMIFIKDLTDGVEAVKISRRAPKPGDKVYNIAAPLGIYKPNIVPILEGRYNGEDENIALYSLPAAPGSSGSMIVNESGQLIGMVHSVFTRFHVMTLSTRYVDLKNFIRNNLKKYMTYKEVMNILNLKDIFEPNP